MFLEELAEQIQNQLALVRELIARDEKNASVYSEPIRVLKTCQIQLKNFNAILALELSDEINAHLILVEEQLPPSVSCNPYISIDIKLINPLVKNEAVRSVNALQGALELASSMGLVALVEKLLAIPNEHYHRSYPRYEGRYLNLLPAFMKAIESGQKEVAVILLDNQKNLIHLEKRVGENLHSPLSLAIKKNHRELAGFLLRKGADQPRAMLHLKFDELTFLLAVDDLDEPRQERLTGLLRESLIKVLNNYKVARQAKSIFEYFGGWFFSGYSKTVKFAAIDTVFNLLKGQPGDISKCMPVLRQGQLGMDIQKWEEDNHQSLEDFLSKFKSDQLDQTSSATINQ